MAKVHYHRCTKDHSHGAGCAVETEVKPKPAVAWHSSFSNPPTPRPAPKTSLDYLPNDAVGVILLVLAVLYISFVATVTALGFYYFSIIGGGLGLGMTTFLPLMLIALFSLEQKNAPKIKS